MYSAVTNSSGNSFFRSEPLPTNADFSDSNIAERAEGSSRSVPVSVDTGKAPHIIGNAKHRRKKDLCRFYKSIVTYSMP